MRRPVYLASAALVLIASVAMPAAAAETMTQPVAADHNNPDAPEWALDVAGEDARVNMTELQRVINAHNNGTAINGHVPTAYDVAEMRQIWNEDLFILEFDKYEAAAVADADDDAQVDLVELQQIIVAWSEGETFNGYDFSLDQIQELIECWSDGESIAHYSPH